MFSSQVLISMLLAGVGGTLPTLSKIAASFAAQPDQPLPHWHILVALLIFVLLGVSLNVPFNGTNDRSKALMVGIAAPALITNIIAGVANAPPPNISLAPAKPSTSFNFFVNLAYADDVNACSESSTQKRLVTFFWRVDGFQNYNSNFSLFRVLYDNCEAPIAEGAVGSTPTFRVPQSATRINLMFLDGHQYVISLPPGEGGIDIQATAYVRTTPNQDLTWAFGARREGTPMSFDFRAFPSQQ